MTVTIHDRTFHFSKLIIAVTRMAIRDDAAKVIIPQCIRSATSIGANVVEAQQAASKKEFLRYMNIALRSARETNYWLRLLKGTQSQQWFDNGAVQESVELARILASIILKGKRT